MKTRYGIEIRAATATDAQGVCDLLQEAGQTIPPHVMAERLDAIRQAQGAALLAGTWGPPSGIVLVHWYRTLDADQPAAQITTLLVAREERRRGIGRLLVKAAAQAARVAGCGALELLASSEDTAMQAFCQATGFSERGARFIRALRKKA